MNKISHWIGRKHTEKTREKMRQAKLKNPTRYWLGKKRYPETIKKMSISRTGKVSPNKGIKLAEEMKERISQKLRGTTQTEERKLKTTGELSGMWKGDSVGNKALHEWVKYWKGKPNTCEHCSKSNFSSRQIHWANVDHKYRRNLNDFLRLCVKCHAKYDQKMGLRTFNKSVMLNA